MAIKINGTTVITDGRTLDVTGASGKFDDLRTSLTGIGTVINFNTPLMTKTMTANTTFTESNKSTGRASVLLLDTSSTGHTPTFSSNIKWPADTTPTWVNNRYWNIGFVCWDNTTVRAVANGFGTLGGGAPAEAIALSGTNSTPNATDFETAYPNPASSGWSLKTNGELITTSGGVDNAAPIPGEWCNVSPGSTYYLRATIMQGSLDTGNSDAVNTWLALSTRRNYVVTAAGGAGNWVAYCRLKFEISTAADGSNIVATGYYLMSALVTP